MSIYQESIREELARNGYIGKYDPRHIEAYMRLEHSTLDGLDLNQFRSEIEISRQCIEEGGADIAEDCAKSFGI